VSTSQAETRGARSPGEKEPFLDGNCSRGSKEQARAKTHEQEIHISLKGEAFLETWKN
jgi:hypothetical protein